MANSDVQRGAWPEWSGKIAVGVGVVVAIAFFWFVFDKGKMVWLHVDSATPVSTQDQRLTETAQKANETSSSLDTVAQAVRVLDEVRREIQSQPVRGRASRELTPGAAEALVFVNAYSDARRFKIGDRVEITSSGKTIPAKVGGTIQNPDDMVVAQLNRTAAEGLGVTERRGVASVTIRRVIDPPPP